HRPYKARVTGSIPVPPTIFPLFYCCTPSRLAVGGFACLLGWFVGLRLRLIQPTKYPEHAGNPTPLKNLLDYAFG
ncbi:hypothetical protein, partial [Marinobacter sp.]|uniref:hypothetical protein n=1 Tax=Marinobacter sp. TaxID=50741 RepID=UPI0034A3A903